MRRSLAFLLSIALTAAVIPGAGMNVHAAEDAPAVEYEAVEFEAAAEEESDVAVDSATEAEAAAEEESDAAVAATTEAEAAAEEEIEASAVEATEAEAAAAEESEIAADAATEAEPAIADAETAAETEPAEETAVVEEPAVAETVLKEAKKAAEEAVRNGFVDEDGKRYFYENGVKKTGWLTINNADYYLKADGEMALGLTYIKGEGTFYFMDSTYAAYSEARKGQMLSGWKTVDGSLRYFKDSRYPGSAKTGKLLTGWKTISGRKYFLADSRTDKYPTGTRLTGWQTIDGKVYYFADENYKSQPKGVMLTGFRTISGSKYYFADSRYKSIRTGARVTGWKTISGKKYYFVDSRYPYSKKTGSMVTGIKTIGGKSYYFNKNGVRKTGWVKTEKGLMAYYTSSGAAGKQGWKKKDSSWYYLTKNGQARAGWMTLSEDSIYYLDPDRAGRMADAPMTIKGKVYFFDENGRRAVTEGWKSNGDYYYYTYKNGRVAVNTTIDGIEVDGSGRTEMDEMDRKAQNYDSSTSNLILVNKSWHTVRVYQRDGDLWRRIKDYDCGDGKSSTPTIEGSFTVGIKMLYFDSGSARCWYATQFCGNYLFHSVLYYQDSGPYSVMDGRVGVGVSHGCVRLQLENARWIYNNISRGTKVIVYR